MKTIKIIYFLFLTRNIKVVLDLFNLCWGLRNDVRRSGLVIQILANYKINIIIGKI